MSLLSAGIATVLYVIIFGALPSSGWHGYGYCPIILLLILIVGAQAIIAEVAFKLRIKLLYDRHI